jgi:DeoR family glycerol-3-phosphate regulon repressor
MSAVVRTEAMMSDLVLNRRQEQLVARVREEGFATVEDLAGHFDVTQQTIRRDLVALCDAGLLRRYHGGVSLPSSVENLAYAKRQHLLHEEKNRIAALLATHIPDDASLFINLGTTNEDVARALMNHKGLRVITNNLNVAIMLSENPSFEVIVAGGVVRGRDHGVTGQPTIELIRQFKVDFGVIRTAPCSISICMKCGWRKPSSNTRDRFSWPPTTASSGAMRWSGSGRFPWYMLGLRIGCRRRRQ